MVLETMAAAAAAMAARASSWMAMGTMKNEKREPPLEEAEGLLTIVG